MGTCTRCGARAGRGWRFCGTCGGSVGVDLDAPTTALYVERGPGAGRHAGSAPVTARPTMSSGAWPGAASPGREGVSWDRSGSGDWAGAVAAVLAGTGAMVGLAALVVAAVAASLPITLPAGQVIAIMMMVVASSAGGSVSASAGGSLGSGSVASSGVTTISVAPLTITVVGFTVMTWVFLRRLPAGERSMASLGLQAARTWAVLMAVLAGVALVGRATIGDAPGSGATTASLTASVTVDLVDTLVFATCWLVLFLTVGVAWRRAEILAPAVRRWRDRIAAPAAGMATTLGLAWLATLGLVLVAAVSGELSSPSGSVLPGASPTGSAEAGVLLAALVLAPNVLLGVFGFAMGVPLQRDSGLGSGSPSINLLTLTDHGAQYWLVALLAGVAVLAGGVVTALRSPTPQLARRNAWQFGVALGVLLCAVAINTAVGAGVAGVGRSAGLDPVLALVVGALWGTVAGFLGAVLASGLRPATIARLRGPEPFGVSAYPATSVGSATGFR